MGELWVWDGEGLSISIPAQDPNNKAGISYFPQNFGKQTFLPRNLTIGCFLTFQIMWVSPCDPEHEFAQFLLPVFYWNVFSIQKRWKNRNKGGESLPWMDSSNGWRRTHQ